MRSSRSANPSGVMLDANELNAVLIRQADAVDGMRIGFAQLNSEKSLNALTLPMIRILDGALHRWSEDPSIACVVLYGAGDKAFCAGGDVRSLRKGIEECPAALPNPPNLAFFSEEYKLDYRIHTYPKPILVWGSGIVMGGGLGLMAGASHRVVTETSQVAMPEIGIGMFPDVGGSWFFSRMQRSFGRFLALTGATINAHDSMVTGLADHFLRAADRDAVFCKLLITHFTGNAAKDRQVLTVILEEISQSAADALPLSNLLRNTSLIENLTSSNSLTAVYTNLVSYAGDDTWLLKAVQSLASGSPTSACLIWELLRRAKDLSLAQVFRLELIVALQCCVHPDFAEGVRARLIDRDNQPRWTPSAFSDMKFGWIDEHFAEPHWPSDGRHPLADLI